MQKINLSLISLALFAVSNAAGASQINQSIPVKVEITSPRQVGLVPQQKEVYLMPLRMTAQQKQQIINYRSKPTRLLNYRADLPAQASQGMNGVPVLDQGRHGTCVTFAVTGVVDALLGKGDYISQLCSLELGDYLGENSWYLGGWNGSNGFWVLDQLLRYGIVSKDKQRSQSCAGRTEYPLADKDDQGQAMTLPDFKAMSEDISQEIVWDHILSEVTRYNVDPIATHYDGDAVLSSVKRALTAEPTEHIHARRVVFGTALPINFCSHAGNCGTYHNNADSWVLTDDMATSQDLDLAGHEMIIYGYDDNAVAYDTNGKAHQGLLQIRNSWGNNVGDNGDYYMSYDFFKKFVLDVDIVAKVDVPEDDE